MFRNPSLVRRCAQLVLAGSLIAAALAGCGGSHTNRPLTVRVSYGFPYLDARTAPQPLVDVFYRWDAGEGKPLMQRRAGSGGMQMSVPRPAVHGATYTLEVWVVREDTGEQIGYASQPIVIPREGEPYNYNINLRGDAAASEPNPYDPVISLN